MKLWFSLLLGTVIAGCYGVAKPADSSDGKSNWLRICSADVDCGEAGSCICGVCTVECTGGSACAKQPGVAAACLDPSKEDVASHCARDAIAAPARICVPRCGPQGRCGEGQRCVDGTCWADDALETSVGECDAGSCFTADASSDASLPATETNATRDSAIPTAGRSADLDAADGVEPPTNLRYATNLVVYVKGKAIVANVSSHDGGDVDAYDVTPSLPAGLALDTLTGTIFGTPSVVAASSGYTVTAANSAGTTDAVLTLAVREPTPCEDGVKLGDEVDVDCGGSCGPCADGLACASGADCSSTHCNVARETCVPTACDDGVQNGMETAVDCGGGQCPGCPGGAACTVGADCISGACAAGTNTCEKTWSRIDTGVPGGTPVGWTGSRILYMTDTGGGWAYELATGNYTPLSSVGAPTFGDPLSPHEYGGGAMVNGRLVLFSDGALYAYDPVGDTWSTLGEPWSQSSDLIQQLVPAGNKVYVVGESDVAAVNPITGAWTPVASPKVIKNLYPPSTRAVWTGSKLLIWNAYHGSGGSYDPKHDTWAAIGGKGAAAGLYSETATWIDQRMILLGGYTGDDPYPGYQQGGFAYDPAEVQTSMQWTRVSTLRAPPPRAAHVAASNGTDIYVFGGQVFKNTDDCASGGVYTPSTDSWSPMDFAEGPCLRNASPHHSRVLTFWVNGQLYATEKAHELWLYAHP